MSSLDTRILGYMKSLRAKQLSSERVAMIADSMRKEQRRLELKRDATSASEKTTMGYLGELFHIIDDYPMKVDLDKHHDDSLRARGGGHAYSALVGRPPKATRASVETPRLRTPRGLHELSEEKLRRTIEAPDTEYSSIGSVGSPRAVHQLSDEPIRRRTIER